MVSEAHQDGQDQLRAHVGDLETFYRNMTLAAEKTGSAIAQEVKTKGLESIRTTVMQKGDDSPVSAVDKLAHEVLTAALKNGSPFPIVSEEDPAGPLAKSEVIQAPFFWLADPLDGTRDFLAGEKTFAVSLALMRVTGAANDRQVEPWFGCVVDPMNSISWRGAMGSKLIKNFEKKEVTIHRSPSTGGPLRILGSRSIPSDRLKRLYEFWGVEKITRIGSALKFAYIAEGEFDAYPRFGPTSEWDTAAGQVLLQVAGGDLASLESFKTMQYGKPNWRNTGFFAAGSQELLVKWMPKIRNEMAARF